MRALSFSVPVHHSFHRHVSLLSWVFLVLTWFQHKAFAQTLVNGQFFTGGLSIINSPSFNTPFQAGSNIPISIEVSGNGKLPSPALLPGSGLPTGYDLLEIYLVSSQTGLNLTVSSGPGLLTGESGTVRHLDFSVPSCVPAGQYNLTFYESSQINSKTFFTITPIPVSISVNKASGGPCSTGINTALPQPQTSSPFGKSPFLPGQEIVITTAVAAPTLSGMITSTIRTTSAGATLSSVGTTFISTPTPSATETLSVSSSTVTLVVVSVETDTITSAGKESLVTSTTTYTTTAVITAGLNTQQDSSGFIPVNTAKTNLPSLIASTLGLTILCFILC